MTIPPQRRQGFGLPLVPASFFSMVLGLAGLGNSWRVAHRVWQLPALVGESLMAIAAVVWALCLGSYLSKWLFARERARAELAHPIESDFVGLLGVATLLIAHAALPYSRSLALVLFVAGAVFAVLYGIWQTGALWQVDGDPDALTGALYLPTVGGSLVTGTVAAALGFVATGQLAFGAGMFSWLAIESVLAHRLYAAVRLPVAQRPTLGIQFAPPAVAGVTYMSITSGAPDLLARALVGYGLLQVLIMVRLSPWIREQPLGPSYWAFTFGAASLSTTTLRMLERGETGVIAWIAPVLFVAANLIVGSISLVTLRLAWQRQLLRA